jgi:hypothetical protein
MADFYRKLLKFFYDFFTILFPILIWGITQNYYKNSFLNFLKSTNNYFEIFLQLLNNSGKILNNF